MSPAATIIAFDLHGVLFTANYRTLLARLWHSKHRSLLMAHALRPSLWYLCARLRYQSRPVEYCIMACLHRWPRLIACRDDLFAMANAQQPNIAMLALASSLKTQGYELHIISNIGSHILADLMERHHEVFALFDHIFTTNAAIGYPSKRNPSFFKAYLASSPSASDKVIILLDDSYKNIEIAATFDMIGIYAKSTEYVKTTLQTLGITV